MFNLITCYYNTINTNRNNEINECLINNLNNKYIKKIYLLNDKIYNFDFLNNENINKIIQIVVDDKNKERLHYNYAIDFINNNIFNETTITIYFISNTN